MAKAKTKILIVEDDKLLIKLLKDKLNQEGFETITAFNGKEGLEQVQAEKPDLVLLDIIMPVMNGLTMLKELRKVSKIPVVILTNLNDGESLNDALESGGYDYLLKVDYTLDDVVNKINRVLKNKG